MSGVKSHGPAGVSAPRPARPLLVHGKWLIDGTGRPPIRDGSVAIVGGRIEAVGPRREVAVPAGARVIERPDHTLVPGMVDAHNHVSLHTLYEELPQTTRPEAEVALWGVHWLRQDLLSGVTTTRTLGEKRLLDVLFKRLQAAGIIEVPRLRIAVHLIVSSLVRVSVSDVVANGADAIRHWVRDAARSGADWIKYYATPNSRSLDPEMPLYSKGEVEVLFEEARMARRPVAAHCHGGQPADWAIELGATSLEHGLFLDERHFAAMGKKGIVLVPTAGVILLQPDEGASPQLVEAKRRARGFLREARRHGVRCVPGTDAVHGNLAFEQQLLVECGWSPQEALECSTREAAALLRMSDQIGTLEGGKLGDVVALAGDLADDPTAFGRVRLVVQDGRVVREDEA
jgi:imidazolonepropionase-like amidohydrolase